MVYRKQPRLFRKQSGLLRKQRTGLRKQTRVFRKQPDYAGCLPGEHMIIEAVTPVVLSQSMSKGIFADKNGEI